MLVCALCVVPIMFASQVESLWLAVALVGLAAAAHQGWSANLFTSPPTCSRRRAVGSVVGIGGMAGAIGGMLIALVVGEILHAHRQLRPDLPDRGLRLPGWRSLIIHLLLPDARARATWTTSEAAA